MNTEQSELEKGAIEYIRGIVEKQKPQPQQPKNESLNSENQAKLEQGAKDYIQGLISGRAMKNVNSDSIAKLRMDVQGLKIPSVADNVPKTTGGYYSRPVADNTGVEDIQQRVKSLSDAMQYASYPVEKAKREAENAAAELQTTGAALKSTFEVYSATPTWQAAQAYNQALAAYQNAKTRYESAFSTYDTAYEQYKAVSDSAGKVFSAWDKYVGDSQASYDAWKGTIRDANVVKQELDAVDAQIKELEPINPGIMKIINMLGNAAANAAASSSSLAPISAAPVTESPELAKLKAQRELLQEEYDWAVHSNQIDIRSTPYFGSLSENDRLMVIDMTEIENMSEADHKAFELWLGYRGVDASDEVRALEKKYTKERLEELESSLRRYLNYESAQDTVRKAKEAAQGFGGGLLSSIATIPMGIVNAITSPFSVAVELLHYDDRYGNLDPNGPGFKGSQWASTVLDTVGKNIAGDVYDENGKQIEDGGWLRQGLSTVYGAGMSALDNLARLAVGVATGGGSAVTLGLAAMGSFGDTVRQISEQGGDPVQALAMGVISGGLEVLTEKYSVENILKVAKGNPLNFKNTLKEMLKQGAIEVSEEEINFLASTLAEAAIMQDKSSYNLEVKELMAAGMSEAEAREQANLSLLAQAGETAVQSFLSGGIMTGAVSTVNNIRYSSLGQKLGLGNATTQDAQAIIDSGLECAEDTDAHQMALKLQKKLDAGKVPTKGELAQQLMANQQAIQAEEQKTQEQQPGTYISMEEYANSKSPIWRNVDYADNETKNSITQQMHKDMVDAGAVVLVSEDVLKQVNEMLPDLRGMKKKDRTPILKVAVNALKNNLRQFLSGFSGQKFDFSVNGKVLEAKLYSTGINEVLEKVTKQKANMLYSTEAIFRNARYLYSTEDYDGDPNIYRWNYFYTPVQIGEDVVGVRIAVRDMATPRESQVYNWGIKKDASLDGEGRGSNDRISPDVSSDASKIIIDQGGGIVNTYDKNGGTENASTYGQAGADSAGAGAGVLYGSGQRNAGTGTGEQAGSLDGSAETAAQRTERLTGASRIKTAVARQNLARSLRLPKVSAQDIGLTKGTERRNLQVLPQEHWDGELQSLAQKIREETGREPMFVVGNMLVKGEDGKNYRIRAAITDSNVILQVDYTKVSLNQILDHEIYHYKFAAVRESGHNLDNMNQLAILDKFTNEEWVAVLDAYLDALGGQYGLDEAKQLSTMDEYNRIVALIKQELLADAYAGINAFGAGADKFTKAVKDQTDGLSLGKKSAQENGVRKTNGPNAEQYSSEVYQNTDFAERNAQNTEREARVAEILNSVSPNHAAQFERYTQLAKENPEQAAREGEELSRGIYGELFDEYRELTEQRDRENKNTARIGGERYSATAVEDFAKPITEQDVAALRSIGRKSVNDFTSEELKKAQKWARRFYQEMGMKSPFFRAWFGEWRENSNAPISYVTENLTATLANGRAKNRDVGIEMSWNAHDVIRETGVHAARDRVSVTAVNQLPEIVKNAVLLDSVVSMPTSNSKMQNTAFMHSFYSVYKTNNAVHIIKLYAEMALNNKGDTVFSRAYQLKDIKRIAVLGDGVLEGEPSLSGANTAIINSISDLIDIVKQYDPEYNPKDASKVVDADGTPMVVYHGSADLFTIFSYGHIGSSTGVGILGDGFYFTDKKGLAENYGENVYPVYLQMKKPYIATQSDAYKLRAKDLQKQGYDGVILQTPQGNVYMVFENTQIKSAADNIGTFDGNNPDIRYSTDDSATDENWRPKSDAEYRMDEAEYRRIRSEMEAKDKQWRDNFLYNELGEEGAERYKATQKMLADREKAERAQRAKEKRIQGGEVKLDVESRATEAKRLLENKLLQTFSIPDGVRGELRAYIGGFADRIVKHGALTEDDRRRFFTRMYEAGAVTIPADDYYGEARSYIKGGHIYVSDSVRAEFGDDWQDIRRRAFAAGIYLTYERTDKNGHSVSGIDVWNNDLAADLPGLFNAEDTDETEILQKIIHVAELGKEDRISLAEYVARVAKEEYTSENDVLDSLERQMCWALESFAETAQVEIQLKERNMRRVLKERQENQERAQRAKERRELQELQQKTLKSLQWLSKNRRLAPEELRDEWDRALSDIDLYAVGAANEMNWSNKYQATWKDLADMYKEARAKDPNFHEDAEIERIISRLDDQKIADMDSAALMDLYKLATGLRTAFYNRNNVLNDEQYRIFEEVYSDSKEELEKAGKGKEGVVDRLLNREQLSAMNVLERMAGWNPDSTWYSMAKQLERGERDVRAFTVKANRILEDFLNEHKEWVMNADGQGKDAIWYEIEVPELTEWGKGNKPIFGDTVTVYMTPAQKVHMYLESKNLDNLRHMEGGRTFVVDKELYGKGKRQEALEQGRTIRLAPETVKQLVSNLTDEEMELAQVLDQYYNGFATGEINRVSNILYGYDKAMGKHYAPIYTNQNYTNSEFGTFDVTAEGVGNLKGRVQYSKNPSYNISAFDAFERNTNQTARFVGMAIPIRNWTTLMNWTEYKNSMKDTVTHAWGLEHKRYIENLLTDLQGGKLDREDVISESGEKLLSNYISAVFGANISIVLKQLGSIPLAGAYLGVGNVVPGQTQVERLDRALVSKYTQDLAWRGMGYSMPETKQLKDHPNWTQNNKAVRFAIGGGAITAMDQWAAGVLWPWAENKVRKEHPELEIGTQEQVNKGESPFYKKVAEEFENAVARSQSTSDQMHQGTLRKSKNTLTRMFTMFTSDSAQTYNTLRQMIGEAAYYKQTGQKEKAGKMASAAGATVAALLLNALWGEAVNLLAAIIKNKGKKYRDEEGEMTALSVLQQMSMGMLSSLSGTVIGGDTLVDMIGAKLLGEKFYAPESMEVSLIQDMYNILDSSMGIILGTIGDVATVVWQGGDVGEYFRQNGNDLLGKVKDAALEIASYWGIPAENVEAYLMGALKFIPGFGAVYDGWFESADKNALGGLKGENLTIRIGRLLDQRGVQASNETADALAALYEAGLTGAVPSPVPGKVTVDGQECALNVAQKQHYGHMWSDVVTSSLDKIVSSDRFAEAEPEVREAILKKLYSYAAEQAKTAMFDDYEPGDTKEDIVAFEEAGLDIADYFAVKAEGHNTDKYLEAVTHGLPEDSADDLMDEIAGLKPMEGEDRVVDVQRWRTCVDMYGNPDFQLAALGAYMSDAQFKKAKAADSLGVDLSDFVKVYEIRAKYDENGNESFSNSEYKKAIDSLSLSTQNSAVLWQLFAGTKSAKNNPYSVSIGQKVLDALGN